MTRKFKRIVQILPVLSKRDAIGEETLLIDSILRSNGIGSEILTLQLDMREPKYLADSLFLYHYSIGCRIPYYLKEWKVPFLLRYHNITPTKFFTTYGEEELTINACQLGIAQLSMLAKMSAARLPVSQYNAQALERAGAKDSFVLPLLRDYSRFVKDSEEEPRSTQFLFVGRLSPNKCQHDLFEILDLYKKSVDPKARLVLVGGGFSSLYNQSLLKLARALQLSVGFDLDKKDFFDITFAQDISETQLAKLYHESSLFLSMSEHEGFCVPLVEAMCAGLPVLAHRSSAIPETLGKAGILVHKKNTMEILQNIETIHTNKFLRRALVEQGKERSKLYSLEKTSQSLLSFLELTLFSIQVSSS